MYIYKALPLYSGFGFTFRKAAGDKMISWETRIKHGLCAQQTVVLRAEDSLGSQRRLPDALAGFLRPSITGP